MIIRFRSYEIFLSLLAIFISPWAPVLQKRNLLSMKESLMQAGLFAEEADAMLNTWELSYFKSPGWRLFFKERSSDETTLYQTFSLRT
jgi:hypothetical protein